MGPFTLKVPLKSKLIKSQNTARRPINPLFRDGEREAGWLSSTFFFHQSEFYIKIEEIIENNLIF